MESPIHGRSCIDIMDTARKHALTGCDSIEATYELRKTITVARKGYTLDLIGQPMADIAKFVKEATVPWLEGIMLFYGRLPSTAVGKEDWIIYSSPKSMQLI